MPDRSVKFMGPFVSLHVIHSPVPFCCLLSHTGMARPLISETAARHQFSIQIMHMHCTHVPLPVWNFFPWPKSSKPSQCLPFFTKCRGPVLLCSCWTHCTCLQLLHRGEFTAISYTNWSLVLWHSFMLRWLLSLASSLVMAKRCCPSPQYGICISKVHLNKEGQETFY